MKLTKYGPKGSLSPSLGDPCLLCGRPMIVGDFTTLIRRPHDKRYADHGAEVHWQCAEPAND
jgi:hypothetical protein